jgi:Na+/phosphate symporter
MMDKEMGERIIRVCQSLMKMLELAFEGFRRPTEKSFREVEEVKDKVHHYSSELTSYIISKSPLNERGREWAKHYLSMASSFDRMTYNIEAILERLKSKAQNHILFSDRAVKEVNDVFQEAMKLLEKLRDLIYTQNKLLARQIAEEGRSMFKIANRYFEEHEERLIQGICVPKHSPIYLGVIESLKEVMVHTLEVSGKIVSLSSKS